MLLLQKLQLLAFQELSSVLVALCVEWFQIHQMKLYDFGLFISWATHWKEKKMLVDSARYKGLK